MKPTKTSALLLLMACTAIIAAAFVIPATLLYCTVNASTWYTSVIYGVGFIISLIAFQPLTLIRTGKVKRFFNDVMRLFRVL